MVKVNVGSNKTFLIRKNFICHYSRVFKAAFNLETAEGQILGADFGGDRDIEPFGMFVDWLYSQAVVIGINRANKYGGTARAHDMTLLIDLWLLADKIMASELQNQALLKLDKLRAQQGGVWTNAVEPPIQRHVTR